MAAESLGAIQVPTGPREFDVRYDAEAGATYITLPGYDEGHARTSTPGADEGVMLDFNEQGFVTGIELVGFAPPATEDRATLHDLREALEAVPHDGKHAPGDYPYSCLGCRVTKILRRPA